jgi:hypothetical protein
MNEWQVVFRGGYVGGYDIYLVRVCGNKTQIMSMTREGNHEIKEFEGNSFAASEVEPILRVPIAWELEFDFSRKLLQALSDKGTILPDKNFAQGKLEATEKHLEDMRKLVFEEPR